MSDDNKGIKYFLICIDVFTRYLYIQSMKDKTKEMVIKSLKKILKDEQPAVLEMDFGSEFVSLPFKKLLKDKNIYAQNVDKGMTNTSLGTLNRVCRTIRDMINKYMTLHNTHTYIDVLPKLICNYNHTFHSGNKGEPAKPGLDLIKNILDKNIEMHK